MHKIQSLHCRRIRVEGPIHKLPREVLCEIFYRFDEKTAQEASGVNKLWQERILYVERAKCLEILNKNFTDLTELLCPDTHALQMHSMMEISDFLQHEFRETTCLRDLAADRRQMQEAIEKMKQGAKYISSLHAQLEELNRRNNPNLQLYLLLSKGVIQDIEEGSLLLLKVVRDKMSENHPLEIENLLAHQCELLIQEQRLVDAAILISELANPVLKEQFFTFLIDRPAEELRQAGKFFEAWQFVREIPPELEPQRSQCLASLSLDSIPQDIDLSISIADDIGEQKLKDSTHFLIAQEYVKVRNVDAADFLYEQIKDPILKETLLDQLHYIMSLRTSYQ